MQGYVRIGIIAAVMLVCILAVGAVAGFVFGTILLVFWAIFVGGLCYMEHLSQVDILARLERAKPSGYFVSEVQTLTTNYKAIESWSEHAESHGVESSIYKSHELLFSQMNNILESAIKFIKSYDYHTNPTPKYLWDLQKQSDKLVKKLHELQDLVLQVDDSTSEVDISYVDDLLSALREMKE